MADSIVSFTVQRSTDNGQNWTTITTPPLPGTARDYLDQTPPANASYRVRGLTALGFEITYNDVTPPQPPPPPPGNGAWIWQVPIKGTSVVDFVDIGAITVDSSNNYIVVGNFVGTVDFGGTSKISVGGQDVFVAKYNVNGTLQWVRQFGDGFDQYATCVAVDSSDNIFIGGHFAGTMTVDGVTLTNTPASSFPYATYDVYVLKLDQLGARIWAKSFPGSGGESCSGIGIDPNQNVFISGVFGLPQNFPALVPFNLGGGDLIPNTPLDMYVCKLNGANGAYIWAIHHSGTGPDRFNFATGISCLAVDSSGDVVVAGSVTGGTIDLGGGDLAASGNNTIVAKYSGIDGSHVWSQVYVSDPGGSNLCRAIAVNGVKDVFVTGAFIVSINIAGIVLHTPQPNSGIYVARLGASNGVPNFANGYGGNFFAQDSGYSIAIDPQQNILITGTVQGSFIDFGGGPRFGDGTLNIFVSKLTGAGTYVWDKRIKTGATLNYGKAIKADSSNRVLVGGLFAGTINFGGPDIVSASNQSGFLVKFDS